MKPAWLAVLLVALACSGSEPIGPSTGNVQVTAATTGADLDPDGYSVAVDGGAYQGLAVNGTVTFSSLSAGDHTVTLSGLAANCVISGPNPVMIAVPPGATAQATFQVSCAPATDFFDDFSSGDVSRWEPSGGRWSVVAGAYQGEETEASTCGAFGPTESLIKDLQARDVDLELDVTSISGVDKGIILRSAGPGDQIELNFRADRGGYPADLIVQEISNCHLTLYTPEFSILIPHQVGEMIHVRVRLVGSQVTIWVKGTLVVDRSFPFANRTGRLGVALFGVAQFDNVRVRVLGT